MRAKSSHIIPGLGERVRQARAIMGLTLQEAADRIPCSKSFIWEVENERRSPSAYNVVQMSWAFGVTPNWLLLGQE